MKKLTKEQAAIIGCYTGIACGPFSDIHELMEKVMERPIFTHEIATIFGGKELMEEVRNKVRPMFLELCYEEPQDSNNAFQESESTTKE